jgi:hypothetical protein
MLVACGSSVGAAPDPQPLPGNPKGSHFDENASAEVLVSGTIIATAIPEEKLKNVEAVFVSIRGESGPPLAAKKLPPGPFPMAFELTAADLVPMGGDRPVPAQFKVKVALDTDGNAMSNDGVGESIQAVDKGQTELKVLLASPGVAPPPPLPVPGNPKGSMYDEPLADEMAKPKMGE